MANNIEKVQFRWKVYHFITFVVGSILSVFSVDLFRNTIVPYYIPLLIILFVGIFTCFVTKRHYQQVLPEWGLFSVFAQSTGSWGLTVCYLFLASNYYWAGGTEKTFNFIIEEKSSLPGSRWSPTQRVPTVTIQYFGLAKDLVFRHSDTKNVTAADSVKVSVIEGFWSFEKIIDYKLI